MKKRSLIRYLTLLAVFAGAVFIYSGKLLNMQFANAHLYQPKITTTYTKTFTVPALRGEIFDRNGVPLVTNKNLHNLIINGQNFPRKNYTERTRAILELIKSSGYTPVPSSLPIEAYTSEGGTVSYAFSMILSSSSDERNRLDSFLERNNLNKAITAPDFFNFLVSKYSLTDYDGDPYSLLELVGLLYDIDRRKVNEGEKYTVVKDIDIQFISKIREQSHLYPELEPFLTYERVYNVPGAASHILGTVGPIYAADYPAYKAKGYPMDAIVGKSGVEQAFEDLLHGVDGVIERTFDSDGNIIAEKYIDGKEPVAGKNIYLTIDIKLQQVAEYSLGKSIERIRALAIKQNKPGRGEDADVGSFVLINPNNGEILALANYPTYDLTTYRTNYNELLKDERNPLFNRATFGTYAPGSIFKIVTSVAALNEELTTVDEKIYDFGVYNKYKEDLNPPRCWLHLLHPGASHGNVNVTEALRDSCNYYYYTMSERIGIDTLNEYSRKFGLGVYTGIEVGEIKGILASREYAASKQEIWSVGELLRAAIGQSYNAFSPLQMATMLSTFINGGIRYSSHLLHEVWEYGSQIPLQYPTTAILDRTEIPDVNYDAIKTGMRDVIETGTASSLFYKWPIKVGGKTGTVQIRSNESETGTFIAFAPYENPEVVLASVIERAGKGTNAGFVAEDVLSYYFGYKTFEEAMDLPPIDTPQDTTAD